MGIDMGLLARGVVAIERMATALERLADATERTVREEFGEEK